MTIQVQTGTASKKANYLREFDPALDLQMNYPAASYGVSEGRCFAWLSMTDQCHSEAESRRISLQIRSKLRGINP